MSLDRGTLRELAGLTDDAGVLSVYVTADPHAEAANHPAWQVRIRNQLTEIRDRVKAEGPRERWQAFEARLAALDIDLSRLLGAQTPGLGRALFAPVGRDEVHTVTLQLPLTDLVTLEPAAYVRPLLTAWAEGSPAGIALANGDGLRVLDYRFGQAKPVAELEYEPDTEDWRELKGPAGGGSSRQSSAQHDLFERRLAAHLTRFLSAAHRTLERSAKDLDWEFLVVAGDTRLAAAVADSLPAAFAPEVICSDRVIGPASPAAIAEAVAEDLQLARRRRDVALVERVRETGPAVRGLDETLIALREGRVAQLLLAADAQWTGSRTPDGSLIPAEVAPAGVELTPEPRLGERMIEQAYASGAEVHMLNPTAATLLRDMNGVAALLRW